MSRASHAPMLDAIRRHRLWDPGDRVAVAVSGGGDSLALLALLAATTYGHGARLSVVTVDHGIHPDSASWADRAERAAESLGIPSTRRSLALGPAASEAEARTARYLAFDELDVDRVALAHHRRDQAETVLVNLLRGTGPRGLAGMPRRRGRYVRPALDLDPEDLAPFRPADAVEDPANLDPAFLRVRIRRELLPLLEAIRPGSTNAIADSATAARADDDLLRSLAAEVPLTRSALAAAPAPLAERRLAELLGPVGRGAIHAARTCIVAGSGRVALGGARWFEVRGDALRVVDGDPGEPAR